MEPLRLIPNLIEQVHARMVDAIADGTLAPGERLTQEEVAERLAVSRQPVSHALQLLKRQGLVVEHGRRGLSVAPVDPIHMRDLYQLRAALDGLAARLAGERVASGAASSREQADLKAALAGGQRLGERGTIHDLIEADVGFHSCIYRLSGNPAISETVRERWPHFRRCMGVSLSQPDRPRSVWAEHVGIAEGILAGSPRAAEGAAIHHAEHAGSMLYRQLSAGAALA